MMVRKKIVPLLAAAAAASLALGLAACAGGAQTTGVRKEFTDSMYTETATSWREQALIARGYTYTGEGITLDGKLDEEKWDQVYPLTYTSVGVTVSVYVVFGTDGFYVGYEIGDTEAYFQDDRASENNSSIEIYFSPVTTATLDSTVLQIRMEPNADITYYRALGQTEAQLSYPWTAGYLPVYGLSRAENGWDVDEETGEWTTDGALQYEMFIGWDALSLDSAPESVKLYPCYNYINSASEDATRVSQVWPQGRYNQPMDYYVFDAEGYRNNDSRLASLYGDAMLLGDAGNGLAKSSAWDFSAVEDGIVSSTENARGSQYVYVKDAADAMYLFTAEAYFIDDVNDSGARMGIVMGRRNSGKTDINMYTETFSVAVQGSNAGKYQLTKKVGDDEGGKFVSWESTALTAFTGNNGLSPDTPVQMTIVKRGEMFFYFINGTYLGSILEAGFSGSCAVGLYTLGAQAVFSEIRYETDEAAIESYLEDADIRLISVTANAGGSFTGTVGGEEFRSSQTAFVGSKDIMLSITPNIDAARTYVISSVTVNGEETELSADGTLELIGCDESVEIVIEFVPVSQGAAITFAGANAQVTIAQQDGVNRYTLDVADGLTVRLGDGTWVISSEEGDSVTVVVKDGEIVEGDSVIEIG